MYITTPKSVDLADISTDVETALNLARALYENYFSEAPKDKRAFASYFSVQYETVKELIGAIIDYTRSAQALIKAFEEQAK